ncbi:MAG: PEP-CTERM sorting domain-containing protein [Candidatus Merdousia sp.]|nr:PEP-CTERM sorting domain-containing protein [Candidatus Merdousia sp.]
MRNTIILLSLFAASYSFAEFTETDTEFASNIKNASGTYTANGFEITGSGSANELQSQNTTALLLNNTTINFDSTDDTTITVGTGAKFQQSNNFSIGTKGNVVLNFKSGSTASLITTYGIAASANAASEAGNITMNVEKGYAGTINLPVIGVVKGTVELNLHNAYALNRTRIYVSNPTVLNMSADQSILWDKRDDNWAKGSFKINITDGASLFVVGKGYGVDSSSYKTSTVKLMGENLLDGYIYFISSMVDSFDNEAKTITLRGLNKNLHTVSFLDKDGNAVNSNSYANFEIGETTIDGVKYTYATMTSIPEPATWAAIFGAIALGLAVYRRRK